jgi:hypothetical protein
MDDMDRGDIKNGQLASGAAQPTARPARACGRIGLNNADCAPLILQTLAPEGKNRIIGPPF